MVGLLPKEEAVLTILAPLEAVDGRLARKGQDPAGVPGRARDGRCPTAPCKQDPALLHLDLPHCWRAGCSLCPVHALGYLALLVIPSSPFDVLAH